jgi:hypothetical protein
LAASKFTFNDGIPESLFLKEVLGEELETLNGHFKQ